MDDVVIAVGILAIISTSVIMMAVVVIAERGRTAWERDRAEILRGMLEEQGRFPRNGLVREVRRRRHLVRQHTSNP